MDVSFVTHFFKKNIEIISLEKGSIQLSTDYIKPNLRDVENIANQFRSEFDVIIKSQLKTSNQWGKIKLVFERNSNSQQIKNYPIGCCFGLSKAFYTYLETEAPDYIKQHKKLNGIHKVVWGNIRNEFFQTSLQIGGYFIDVANDTVDPSQPKVKISKIGSIDFKNFNNLLEFIKVKEPYHETSIFYNDSIPEISDWFPLMEIKNGNLLFVQEIESVRLNLKNRTRQFEIPNSSSIDDSFLKKFFHEKIMKQVLSLPNNKSRYNYLKKIITLYNATILKKGYDHIS